MTPPPRAARRRRLAAAMKRIPSAGFLHAERIIARLPWRVQRLLGGALGRLGYRLLGQRRRIAAVNLAACFPDLDADARACLLRRHFRSLGLGLVETALAHWGDDEQILPRSKILGAEHVDAALSRGKGVILLGAHFATMELSGRIVASRYRVGALYRPHNDPALDALIRAGREQYLDAPIPHRNIRAILAHLGRNGVLWYAPDQDHGGRRRVFARFFTEPAATTTAPAWLARASGAQVVPMASWRDPDDGGWRVTFEPPLTDFPGADDAAAAQRLNDILAAQIKRAPDQYLWIHRRFKTRPAGAPPRYPPSLLRRRPRPPTG